MQYNTWQVLKKTAEQTTALTEYVLSTSDITIIEVVIKFLEAVP